ncbi:hypothetical protein ACPEIC_45810 [Stenotrophomonas sp. NPDC087984]
MFRCAFGVAVDTAILTMLWSWNDLIYPLVISTDPRKMTLSAGLATPE